MFPAKLIFQDSLIAGRDLVAVDVNESVEGNWARFCFWKRRWLVSDRSDLCLDSCFHCRHRTLV